MKLSVMLYSLSRVIGSGEKTVPEVCEFLRDECDITALEIMQGNVDAVGGVREMMTVLDNLGSHVACYIGGGNLVKATDAEQQPAIDAIKQAVDNCAEMGCKLMLATTGGSTPDIPAPEARKRIAAGLREVIPHAKAAGITFTIEDVGSVSAPYGTSSDLLEMCELVGPDLMLTYDNGNFLTRGEDPNAALGRVWGRVAHVHCKDWRLVPEDEDTTRYCVGAHDKHYQGVVCGEGLMDYPANFAALEQRGYTGYLSFEYEGVGDQLDAARRGIANLRALL